jgi:hypothetical protein
MGGYRCGRPRTDLGTIILHWLLTAALIAATVTGLCIGCTGRGCDWIKAIWSAPPSPKLWADHIVSAFVLTVVAIAYPTYIWRAGLARRVVFDRVRLIQLGRPKYRWAAVNVIFNWICHSAIFAELVSGGLLLFGYTGSVLLEIHRIGTWIIVVYAPIHVLMHLAYGGFQQLLRLFRPIALPPRQPRFDQKRYMGASSARNMAGSTLPTKQQSDHPTNQACDGSEEAESVVADDQTASSPGTRCG